MFKIDRTISFRGVDIEYERVFLPYFRDYVIDWSRIPDEVNAILDMKEKGD